MTKRGRTILFVSFVLIFLISVPPMIFYADGYRIDFLHLRVVKVGALRINALPFPADTYINGKFIESTNFLFRTTFISDLLPQNYLIQVKKDGFQTWQKQLTITEGEITGATAITLFPQSPLQTIIKPDVRFFPEAGGRAAIIAPEVQNSLGGIGVYTSRNHQLQKLTTPVSAGLLSDVVWANDASRAFLIFAKPNGELSYFIASNLNGEPTATPVSGMLTLLRQKAAFSRWQWSNDGSHILALVSYPATKDTGRDLYYIKLSENVSAGTQSANLLQAALDNSTRYVRDFIVLPDGIYTIEGPTNVLVRYSAALSEGRQISSVPYPALFNAPSAGIRLIGNSSTLFALHADGQLFLFDQDARNFTKITDNIVNIMPAPDNLKVALQKNNEVYLYWIKDINDIPGHKKGDVELVWRLSEPIKYIAWLSAPYQYLAVGTPDSLNISELDTRDGRNIISYKQIIPNSPMIWGGQNQELLLLNNRDAVGVSFDKVAQ